jgi:serine/threonine protein kinase
LSSALPHTLTLRLSFFKDDADGNSFEDDEDAEGYEPWSLARHHASQPAAAMAQRYELLGRKQGEEDLGEGRAGVVRKCLERLPEADEGQGQGQAVVRACKCISKRQQSEEETDRELAIMRKLRGNKSAFRKRDSLFRCLSRARALTLLFSRPTLNTIPSEHHSRFKRFWPSLCWLGVPGVCQLLALYEAPDRLFLVTELCGGGELYNHVIARAEAVDGAPFSEPDAALIMKQVRVPVCSFCRGVIAHLFSM